MSEQSPDAMPAWVERMTVRTSVVPADAEATLRRAAAEVMDVQDVTTAKDRSPMRFRGRLTLPADEAFKRLRPQFESVGHTPYMRREEGAEVIRALPVVFGKGPRKISRVAILLLIATIISVFYIGMSRSEHIFIDPLSWLIMKATGDVNSVKDFEGKSILVEHPELIPSDADVAAAAGDGLLYALALLGILGTHEMGHYIVARINKVHTSPPYFIPLPSPYLSPFGTLGAVIFMQEPSPNRRVQFDIGVAGPLAGFIVALPALYLGLRMSTVGTVADFVSKLPAYVQQNISIMAEGQSLLYLGMKYLVFGQILPRGDVDVWISPVAFAAWAGLLVTALNLMPAGQLDGGHVIYGLFGERAGKLRIPVVVILGILSLAGFLRESGIIDLGFGWSGWLLWMGILYFLARTPAPVLDEITGLDTRRRLVAIATLVIFILIFTPTPLVIHPAASTGILSRLFI